MQGMRATSTELGFSLIELVVTVAISATMMGIAVTQFNDMLNPAQSSASNIAAFFKEARARAVSTTSAYRVQPTSSRQIVAYFGNTCSNTPSQDPRLMLDLPTDVTLTSIGWNTCFSSRGLADTNTTVSVIDDEGLSQSIEVFLGGAVRIN